MFHHPNWPACWRSCLPASCRAASRLQVYSDRPCHGRADGCSTCSVRDINPVVDTTIMLHICYGLVRLWHRYADDHTATGWLIAIGFVCAQWCLQRPENAPATSSMTSRRVATTTSMTTSALSCMCLRTQVAATSSCNCSSRRLRIPAARLPVQPPLRLRFVCRDYLGVNAVDLQYPQRSELLLNDTDEILVWQLCT